MNIESISRIRKEFEIEANEFLKKAYGLELLIPIVINPRLKSTYGRFIHTRSRKESLRIEISKNYIEHQDWEVVLQTLIHECIHYAMYEQNLPFHDGHPVFEAEIKKWGSHSTGTVKYHGKVVQYECTGCGYKYNRKKRYPRNRTYNSGCCKKAIKFVGEKVV